MSSRKSTIDLDNFNELINCIYDAAVDVTLWPAFIKRLIQSLNSQSGLIRVQNLQSNEVGAYITQGLDPEFQRLYREHYINLDILTPVLEHYDTGHILQTATDAPESFKKSEFYNDYALPQGMIHSIGCTLMKDDSRLGVLGIHRPNKDGYYKEHEIELIKLLTPHLQRAFKVNSHISQLTEKRDIAYSTLDYLSIGIILVDIYGWPVFINEQAEAMLAEGNGLSITRHGLKTSTHKNTQLLHKLIFNATQAVPRTGGAISVSSPKATQAVNILVSPINNEKEFLFNIDSSKTAAAMFFGITGKQFDFSIEVLRRFYGLTHAEARLAAELANGKSMETIAEKFSLSKNTIRSQLKSCFHKTGVNRQTELVKLILSDPAATVRDNNY